METITEGSAKIFGSIQKISKKLDVFYNPIMKFNKDATILLLNCVENKPMQVCDLLAGSGIRSLRMLKELKKGKLKSIFINDKHAGFFDTIRQNLELNSIPEKQAKFYESNSDYKYNIVRSKTSINKKLTIEKKINVTNEEGSQLLLKTSGFDYIDIDPFGSPNPFLDAAVKMVSRGGIIGITLTDTAALTGTYINAGKRKYWAKAVKNEFMHETGVRIFIRKVQLIGAQYEKALAPILSIAKDHYYRVFFRAEKGKQKVDQLLGQHKYFIHCQKCFKNSFSVFNNKECCDSQGLWAGPLWAGKLHEKSLLKKMAKISEGETKQYFELLLEEDSIDSAFFFDIHKMCKELKLQNLPSFGTIINSIQSKKFLASRTQFNRFGIKTDIQAEELRKILVYKK